MKKGITLFILFLLSFSSIYSQEKLVDILEKLSVKNKVIKTKQIAESSSYFELLNSKLNFEIKERELRAYYVSSYKKYNIYQLDSKWVYTDQNYDKYYNPNIANSGIKFALLFDTERQRCYMIKYSGDRFFYVKSIDRYNKISINPRYDTGINSIIRLDEGLKPLYGTILNSYIIDRVDRKPDEFVALFKFKQYEDGIYSIMINIPSININDVAEDEFAKLFSDESGYTEHIYPDWEKQDMGRMFDYGGMF